MGLDSLKDGVVGFVTANKAATAVGAGVVGAGLVVGAVALSRKKTKRKTRKSGPKRKRIKHTSRGWAQDRKRKSKQKWEVAYRKRKKKHNSRSSKRRGKVHYARKTGQPYIILASGKAKFIKGKRRNK